MNLKIYAVALLIFIVLDLVWLGLVAKNFYAEQLGYILSPKVNWWAAIVFYVLFIGGLVSFVIAPAVEAGSWQKALLLGAFFGIIAYGTYDLTNHATLKDWPLVVTIVDIIWGGIISATVAYATYLVATRLL